MTTTNPDKLLFAPDLLAAAEFLYQELLLRGGLILLAGILLVLMFSNRRATVRSALWLTLISAMAILPLLAGLLPELPIPVSAENQVASFLSGHWPSFAALQESRSLNLVTGLAGLYFIVTAFGIAYLLMGIVQLLGIENRAHPDDDGEAAHLTESLRSTHGIENPVHIAYSNEIQSPLTFGLLRHRLLLPEEARHWPQALLRQCISHELAHIQRMDWVCLLTSRLVLCMYWFNPLVWWLHGKFVEDSEKACDAVVIDDTGCPVTYAENLLWLASSFSKNPLKAPFSKNPLKAPCKNQPNAAMALLKSRSILYRRVAYILGDNAFRPADGRSSLIAGLVFSVVLVAPLSAMKFNLIETVERPAESQLIQVSFYPRGSGDHARLMNEFNQVVDSLREKTW